MLSPIQIKAASLMNALAEARRQFKLPTNEWPKIISESEDGLHRVHFARGQIAEITVECHSSTTVFYQKEGEQ